jgi:DNA-directed RNA polymerase specialized sigma24 family protein
MSELEDRLRQLVVEACGHPPGSLLRQKKLTQIIRLTTHKLWKENVSYYQDALQQTWIFFCHNICESTTGDRYNPDRGSVATWLNAYLRRRLQDFYIDQQKQKAHRAPDQIRMSRSADAGDMIDVIDTLPANPDVPPILAAVKKWAEADPDGELRSTHIEGNPKVNCQVLILRRLPPETGWKELSEELGLSISTLSSFYQRQCMPRLRKFGESEGYI